MRPRRYQVKSAMVREMHLLSPIKPWYILLSSLPFRDIKPVAGATQCPQMAAADDGGLCFAKLEEKEAKS